MRTCTSCGQEKNESEFYKQSGGKGGLKAACKECILKSNRKWRRNNSERMAELRRADHYKVKYNITIEDYDNMLEAQDNGCAICGKTPEDNRGRLHVDHDHETGEIRGLLCGNCNKALGLFQDDITSLRSAINYLRSN